MKTKLLLFVIVFSFVFSGLKAQVDVGDSLALVDLYNATNGAGWVHKTNWLSNAPVSTWYGVYVKRKRVTGLTLEYNRLKGTIPSTIGNITGLQDLTLNGNNLTSRIPISIGNLSLLTYFDLSQNKLEGEIPNTIGKLINLKSFDVGFNRLTGAIPASIGQLRQLTNFTANTNALTGNLPYTIGNLTNLDYFNVVNNKISGNIPSSIGRLHSLENLQLSYNQLTGTLPDSIGELTNLHYLDCGHNLLNGTFPIAVTKLTNLLYIWLGNNQLTGVIPTEIENLSKVITVSFRCNKLSGPIPSTFGKLKELAVLQLDSNYLSGEIPDSLSEAKHLSQLDLGHNLLTGSLPKTIAGLHSMNWIDVSYNSLKQLNNVFSNQTYDMFGYLNNNYLTFDGLEFIASKCKNVTYTPQSTIVAIHQHNKFLAVSAGGTLSNNTYKWFQIGKPDSTIVHGDSTFQPTHTGVYYARVTNSVVVALTLTTDTFTYVMPLVKNEMKIVISPNPARGMIGIYGLNEKSDAKITIADVSGYVWMKAISRQQSAMKIDVSRLKPGNYLLNVSDGKDVKTVMFVKE